MPLIIHQHGTNHIKVRNIMNTYPILQQQMITALQTLYDTEAVVPLMEFCQGEMRVLFYLLSHTGEKVYPSQLSEALVVTRQRITTVLSAMRKKGLIQMEVEERDRRKFSVTLTEAGKAAALKKQQGAYAYLGSLMENLGEQDSRELVRLMQRCAEIVTASSPMPKGENDEL